MEFVWHNLKENKNDLPPLSNDGVGNFSDEVILDIGCTGYYSFEDEEWYMSNTDEIITDVCAWGFIPVFQK